MTLEAKLKTIKKTLEAKHPFLKETRLYIEDSEFPTKYNPKGNYIEFSIAHLRSVLFDASKVKRYENRLGKISNLEHLAVLTLLHELKHVIDYKKYGQDMVISYRTVIDNQSHDENEFEQRADNYAKRLYPLIK